MSGEPENIVLVYLRRLDERMARIEADLATVKHRLTSPEIPPANLSATVANQYASLATRMDLIEGRLERIERRLDIVAAK